MILKAGDKMTALSDLIANFLATLQRQYDEQYREIQSLKESNKPDIEDISARYGFLVAIQGISTFYDRFIEEWTLQDQGEFASMTSDMDEATKKNYITTHNILPDDPRYFNKLVDMLTSTLKHYVAQRSFVKDTMTAVQQEFPEVDEASLRSGIDTLLEFIEGIRPEFTRDLDVDHKPEDINLDLEFN